MSTEYTEYTIRPASEADQSAIRILIRDAGINPLGIHWSRFLVAVDAADELIGCGQLKGHGDGSHELASIAVTRARRGRGVAGDIIKALQKTHDVPLWLTCMDKLIPFYRQFGFIVVETPDDMPAYFRRASRFFNFYLALTRGKGRLAVMVWRDREM